MIPHSKPYIGKEEVDAVQRVAASGHLAQGPEVFALEEELALFLGVKGAVAVSSGTAGLHLALRALGVGKNHLIHIPSYVCAALLNAVNYTLATPSVCDVDPNSGNMDADDLSERITASPQAVILPHMFGIPAQVEKFTAFGFPVIEDCAQAIGATLGEQKVGTYGTLSVFSFYATKVICAGEGGAVVSDSIELLERVRDLRDYDERVDYQTRYNYKLTDLQAAVARIQLKRLPDFIARRRAIAQEYDRAIERTRWTKLNRPAGDIFFRYIIHCDNPTHLIDLFRDEGITACLPVYRPIHRYLGLSGCPGTERIHSSAVSLPCYPALSDGEVEAVAAAIGKLGGK